MFFPAGHLRVWCLFFPTDGMSIDIPWRFEEYAIIFYHISMILLDAHGCVFVATLSLVTRRSSPLLSLVRWQHIVKWVNKHLERDHVLKSVEDFSTTGHGAPGRFIEWGKHPQPWMTWMGRSIVFCQPANNFMFAWYLGWAMNWRKFAHQMNVNQPQMERGVSNSWMFRVGFVSRNQNSVVCLAETKPSSPGWRNHFVHHFWSCKIISKYTIWIKLG